MSTNILALVKNISKKHPNWKVLYRKLQMDGKIVDPKKFDEVTRSYYWENMNLIERYDTGIVLKSITIVGRPSVIEPNHIANFDINGDFIDGKVNTFAFGIFPLDEAHLETYFSECQKDFQSVNYWDVISDGTDDVIHEHLAQFHINFDAMTE